MPFTFKFVTVGLQSAISMLGELQLVMSDVNRTDIRLMAAAGKRNVKKHFRDQGPGWEARKPSTIRRMIYNARAENPRRDISRLNARLLMNYYTLMNGTKDIITANGFIIKNEVPYMEYQNRMREFMYFDDEAINEMTNVPFIRLQKAANKRFDIK